jgi:hypothetical protein
MKSWKVLLLFVCIISIKVNAQQKYSLPKGYEIYKYEGQRFRIDNDIDGDGVNDLAIVLSKKNSEDENIVTVFLSSNYFVNSRYYSFAFSSGSYSFEFKNNVFAVGTCFGNGRFCKQLKFKYIPSLKTMRLIGYEEESFGNAVHEGAYLKSVNFLTNRYEISGPAWKKKLQRKGSFQVIKIENLNEKLFDYLESIGSKDLQ